MEFKEIVQKRYAVKKFNNETLPQEKVDELFEMIRLAPSSFGLQPWRVKVVTDQATKEKLLPLSWNQPQITTCSHLLVFCATTNITQQIDRYEAMMQQAGVPEEKSSVYINMMRDFVANLTPEQKLNWAQKQTYIAMTNALNGATALGFDACPMEGFDAQKYHEALSLPEDLVATVVVPIGYAADEPREKLRYSKEEMFF